MSEAMIKLQTIIQQLDGENTNPPIDHFQLMLYLTAIGEQLSSTQQTDFVQLLTDAQTTPDTMVAWLLEINPSIGEILHEVSQKQQLAHSD